MEGRNTLKMNTTTINNYRLLTTYYNAKNIRSTTFSVINEQRLQVIIKNVLMSLSEEDVKSGLLLNYLDVKKSRTTIKQRLNTYATQRSGIRKKRKFNGNIQF